MEIPNYDFNEDENTNFTQLCKYMPDKPFRMLICGNSGSGKTNPYHMLMKPLVYFDQVHLYGKNLEQEKYKHMIETMNDISKQAGYDIIHYNNDEIKPVDSLDSDSQKIVIFDDFICDKNQKPLIDYFIQGRHKNCSAIYLSQSFYKTPKDIRLNCNHYVVYDFPSNNERNLISRELNNLSQKINMKKQLKNHIHFYMLINQRNWLKGIFMEIYNLIVYGNI